MKKYFLNKSLFAMAAFLLCCLASCSDYQPFDEHDLTVMTYEKDFVNEFGKPVINHQWGFVQQPIIEYPSQTRAYINANSNMWASDYHLNVPEAITNDEMNYVKAWFSNPVNTRTACEAVHFEDFFIQHVSCDRSNMSELHVRNLDGSDIHINGFNGNSGAIMYVGQAGTEAWSYASTQSTGSYYRQWDLYYTQYLKFTVNGKEYEGWYIGFDYEFAKENLGPESGEYKQFVFRDGVYNDWIVKVSPALHDGNSTMRVMCEDLGSDADWDYNDVVFDVAFTQEAGVYYANIVLRAVSGTLPIYVGKIDSDYEAHKLLGDGTLKPICRTKNISVYKIKLSDIGIKYSGSVTSASASAIPVYVEGPNGVYTLANSSIAQKLACPDNTVWADEGQKISLVYPNFLNWVNNESVSWTTDNNEGSSQPQDNNNQQQGQENNNQQGSDNNNQNVTEDVDLATYGALVTKASLDGGQTSNLGSTYYPVAVSDLPASGIVQITYIYNTTSDVMKDNQPEMIGAKLNESNPYYIYWEASNVSNVVMTKVQHQSYLSVTFQVDASNYKTYDRLLLRTYAQGINTSDFIGVYVK